MRAPAVRAVDDTQLLGGFDTSRATLFPNGGVCTHNDCRRIAEILFVRTRNRAYRHTHTHTYMLSNDPFEI